VSEAAEASRAQAPGESRTDGALDVVTLARIQENEELSSFITAADRVMEALGYTEHGFRHANLTARIAFQVLSRLGFDEPTANRGCVAGYLHDVGNMVSREGHGQTGALLVYHALRDRAPPADLASVVAAIANHEEENGWAVSPEAAAVMGFLAGCYQDTLSGGPLGLRAFTLTLMAFAAARLGREMEASRPAAQFAVLLGGAALAGAITLLTLSFFFGPPPLLHTLVRVLLPETLLTAALGTALMAAARAWRIARRVAP